MANRCARLLNRTNLLPGEALHSFVKRLADINYYFEPFEILHLMNQVHDAYKLPMHYYQLSLPRAPGVVLHTLSEISGVSFDDLYSSSSHRLLEAINFLPVHSNDRVSEKRIRKPGKGVTQNDRYFVASHRAQYCPACLQEEAYYRLSWIPKSSSACLTHKCLMIDRCQGCSKGLSMNEIVDRHCAKCGLDLCSVDVISVSEDAQGLDVQWLLEYLLGLQSSPYERKYKDMLKCPSSVAYHMLWSLRHHCIPPGVIWKDFSSPINDIAGDLVNRTEYLTSYESFLSFRAVGIAFLDWPSGLYTFLDSCIDSDYFQLSDRLANWILNRFTTDQHRLLVTELINYCLDRHLSMPISLMNYADNDDWFAEETWRFIPTAYPKDDRVKWHQKSRKHKTTTNYYSNNAPKGF